MAFDGIFLHKVVQSLSNELIGRKIDKINQPEKDEIHISFRNLKKIKLLISASSSYPRIHMTKQTKPNPDKAPMFSMVLRKYLIGGKILSIKQYNSDRFLSMDIETTDEMGFNSVYTLYIEIMGRHSNITLVRSRDNKIMDCIKHITPEINTVRVLLPNVEYVFPPLSDRIDPYDTTSSPDNILGNPIGNSSFYSKTFNGIGKQFSKELYTENISKENFDKVIYEDILNKLSQIEDQNVSYIFMDNNGKVIDFYCCDLPSLKYTSAKKFENINDLLDEYYAVKDKQDRLTSKACSLTKLVKNNIERCEKKQKILNNELSDCLKKEDYKIKGELLTSYIHSLKQGEKEVTLQNYYSENLEEIKIKLDPLKTPSENLQSYFKKYNKLKKTESAANEQLEKNTEELDYLNSVLTSIINAEEYTDIEDIRNELVESGYVRHTRNNGKKKDKSKPMHFISSDGISIYVGKNNIQNDYLTLKFADKRDLWLHTKNIPGSHVIVKAFDVPDTTLAEAAALAAYYSKGKNSSKVDVDYTIVKNVKKPSGAKPGMVIYYTNSTIVTEPKEPDIEKVR